MYARALHLRPPYLCTVAVNMALVVVQCDTTAAHLEQPRAGRAAAGRAAAARPAHWQGDTTARARKMPIKARTNQVALSLLAT